MPTRFFELAGVEARARLTALGSELAAAGERVRLLRSRDRDDLYLLVAEGDVVPPSATVPTDARVWTFEPCEVELR